MSWIDVLNASGHRVALDGASSAEVLYWAYEPHLRDNALHRHTFVEACFVGRYGAGCFTVGGQEHAIGAGDAFFARPGVLHRIHNTISPDMELFWVSFALAPKASGQNETALAQFADSPLLVAHDHGGVAATWSALRACAEQPRVFTTAALEHLKAALILALLQLGTLDGNETQEPLLARDESARNAALIRVAMRYIRDNLDRRLPVSEVAAHVHLSPRHFARLMQAHAGAAPSDFIERARLDRACALLRGSDSPLKVVGAQVGYSDVHHFSRAFAKRFGVAPGAFRRGLETKPEHTRPSGVLA